MARFFKVKNYEKFQHYKDRAPPWIKLYNETLENYEFGSLADATKGQLIGIWLLASRTNNKLPYDPRWIATKINATDPVDLDALYEAGFIIEIDEAENTKQVATPAQRNAKANGFGSRHISDATKRAVWDRDGGKCCSCGSTKNIEYDHKHPVSKGGNSEEGNIQLLCRPCNRAKRVSLATPAQPLRSLGGEREEERQDKTEKKSRAASPSNEDFENFKRDYPKRAGQYGWKAAERKYLALVKTGVNPKMIALALVRFSEEMRKLKRIGTEFIPMPASWLNSEDFVEYAAATFDPKPVDWDALVRVYQTLGTWPTRDVGNDPSSPSCRAPPEILRKYGLELGRHH